MSAKNKKNIYKSVSLHFTIHDLLNRLSAKLNPGRKLSIPTTITLLAESKHWEFICAEQWGKNMRKRT
jgi:hypothetical protein